MNFETNFEKSIRQKVDTLIGNKDENLKEVLRVSLTYDKDEPIVNETVEKIKKANLKIAEYLQNEEFMIHDNDGKLIPYKISQPIINE
jgi:hypothetical protein